MTDENVVELKSRPGKKKGLREIKINVPNAWFESGIVPDSWLEEVQRGFIEMLSRDEIYEATIPLGCEEIGVAITLIDQVLGAKREAAMPF